MTRLQSRTASCECGKTTREKESFVQNTKFYETRSSGRLSAGNLFRRRRTSSDHAHLGKKIYIKKVNNSIIKMHTKNKRCNSESKLKTRKVSQSCAKEVTSNGTARSIIDSALDILNGKLGMDIIDSNCIRSNDKLEGFTVSNTFVPNGMVSDLDDGKLCNFQNGGVNLTKYDVETDEKFVKNLNSNILIKEEVVYGSITNDLSSTGEEIALDKNINTCQEISDSFEEGKGEEDSTLEDLKSEDLNCTYESKSDDSNSDNKVGHHHKKRKRTSQFQKLIESCSELNLCASSRKRCRKRPESFSPELKRKIKRENLAPVKSNLTLSGKVKKKCGRKPRPKGPILHYLDVYVQSKERPLLQTCAINNTSEEGLADKCDITCTKNCEELPKIEENVTDGGAIVKELPILLPPSGSISKIELCKSDTKEIQLKKIKKRKKKTVTSKKTISKQFDKTIQTILGYRCLNGVNEFLVLFKNGTSNWINENMDDSALFTNIQLFFEHSDQEQSIINRLGFTLAQSIKKRTVMSDCNSSITSDTDVESEDCDDDVFFKTSFSKQPNHENEHCSKQNSVDVLSPVRSTKTFLCPSDEQISCNSDLLLTSDLNELCQCVMSSKHLKLYPYETTKEIVSKKDGGFVHVYLKRLNKKMFDTTSKKTDDHFNTKTCEKLITILEDSAVDDHCDVVIIAGLEDFFALNNVFDKLLKNSSSIEVKKYEQDISLLRYLVQTIRNFNKPIVAVIKKTAIGLPASLLSLFDMVFDERSTEAVTGTPTRGKKKKKGLKTTSIKCAANSTDDSTTDDQGASESYQNFVFPRLMGLTESNEARIMGERCRPVVSSIDQILVDSSYNNRVLSQRLKNSVRHMKNNSRIELKCRGRSQSLSNEDEGSSSPCQNTFSHVNSSEASVISKSEVATLEEKVRKEKELTRQCMDDLASYLKSIESNTFV